MSSEEFAEFVVNPVWRENLLLEAQLMMPEGDWRAVVDATLEKIRAYPDAPERGVMIYLISEVSG